MRRPWTEEDIKTLYDLKKQKLKDKEIANILNRTVKSIEMKWNYLNKVRKKVKKVKHIDVKRCPICKSENTIGKTLTFIGQNSARAYYCSDCLVEFNKKGILEPMFT